MQKILGVMIGLGMCVSAHGQTLDFEDLTLGAEYAEGESFVSQGVTVSVPVSVDGFGTLYVSAWGEEGGTGNELGIFSWGAAQFDIPGPGAMTTVTMKVADYYGHVGVKVDHAEEVVSSLADLDGVVMPNGVALSLVDQQAILGGERGVLSFTGAFFSFTLSGVELVVDDVVITPEPTSLAVVALGAAWVLFRRRVAEIRTIAGRRGGGDG
jgi:hypothetical protein